MLINSFHPIKINRMNIEWYYSRGYECLLGDVLCVKSEDLTRGSHVKVLIYCDYCLDNSGSRVAIEKSFYSYVKQNESSIIKKDCCKECKHLKVAESNMKKYGVESTLELGEVKDKIKKTNIARYGVDNPLKSEKIRKKAKSTIMEKYGVENPFQSDSVKEKIKETNTAKYGAENYMQTKEGQRKVRETNVLRYGTEYPMQREEVREKSRLTSLENWGVDNPMKSNEVQSLLKETMQKRYGVDNYSQTDDYLEKFKATSMLNWGTEHPHQSEEIKRKTRDNNMKKYGVEHTLQLESVQKKRVETLYKYGDVKTSSQQMYVYNRLKEMGFDVYLNYPFSTLNLDVALFIDGLKIDVEYDGTYWHQDFQRDRRRDEYLKSEGWKVFRIRSKRSIPSDTELLDGIQKLLESDRTFLQIRLKDALCDEDDVS